MKNRLRATDEVSSSSRRRNDAITKPGRRTWDKCGVEVAAIAPALSTPLPARPPQGAMHSCCAPLCLLTMAASRGACRWLSSMMSCHIGSEPSRPRACAACDG